MMETVNLPLILAAALIAAASPGPATLAIAGTSMTAGRRAGLAVAAGVTTGSWMWSVSAALGLGALMLANAWAVEGLRYAGAGYLLYLAYRSARSALTPGDPPTRPVRPVRPVRPARTVAASVRRAYGKGLALHLTNPKAILFFGSLFAIGVPPGSPPEVLATVIAAVGVQSLLVFHGYALLFSSPPMMAGYLRLRRGFEGLFALAFGAAGLRILTSRLQ